MMEDYVDIEPVYEIGQSWPSAIMVSKYARHESRCSCCHHLESTLDPLPYDTKMYVMQDE